ncbi:MAG TPA: alkaline phosphatase family protein, partial [Steroidobacteraceae bacterium]
MPARAAASLPILLALGLAVTTAPAGEALLPSSAQAARNEALPPIRHVFVLLLENQSYGVTFGSHAPASYLARALPARGALLTQYYAIGHASLGNYIALISGQAPNLATQLDCSTYTDFRASAASLDQHGQLHGSGCIYPRSVPSLPDQLETAGFSWRAYMEDMGKNPAREAATCGHVRLGAAETTSVASAGDQY